MNLYMKWFIKNCLYDPDTWRPYCHVLDFARLIHKVIKDENKNTKGQIFNAGSNKNNFTKRQIVELISKYIRNCNVIFQEKGSDPRNYKVNFDKVNQYLNFVTKYDVEDNILDMINIIKNYKITDKSKYGNYQYNNEKRFVEEIIKMSINLIKKHISYMNLVLMLLIQCN